MEKVKQNKGGRPAKEIKRNITITVHCSAFEKRLLREKSQDFGISLSEYLRQTGLDHKITRHRKDYPKEALVLNGMLNHIAANLNQIAKKRNSGEELGAYRRIQLEELSEQLHLLTQQIRNYFI